MAFDVTAAQRNGTAPVLLDHLGQPMRRAEASPKRPAHGMAIPGVMGFFGRVGGRNTFWHDRFDEALRHGREDAHSLRRDGWIQSMLLERYRGVANLPWHLEVPDEKDQRQLRVKELLTQAVKSIPGFTRMLLWWLDATWYGKYGVQLDWVWQHYQGHRILSIRDSAPVNGDKFGHRYYDEDSKRYIDKPYLLFDPSQRSWIEEHYHPQIIVTTLGQGIVLDGWLRSRFVLHEYLADDPDFFQAEQAEALHGLGVRSRTYWLCFLRLEWLANVSDFLQRVGLGITLWKYRQGDAADYAAMVKASQDQSDRCHIYVPYTTDASGKEVDRVQRIDPPVTGVKELRDLIQYLDGQIERHIIGQEASSRGTSGGLGNEANANLQASTKADILQLDARLLGETITGTPTRPGILSLMQRWSFPETMPEQKGGFPVRFVFDVEKPESDKKLQAAEKIWQMGIGIKETEVLAAGGFSEPGHGDVVVKQQQQQPGQGGAPGAGGPGGGEGGNPLAALMGGQGGQGGQPAPEQPGQPQEAGQSAPGAPAAPTAAGGPPPEGSVAASVADILNGKMQFARRGEPVRHAAQHAPLRYGWIDMGPSHRDPSGRRRVWVGIGDSKGQRRVQVSQPGTHSESRRLRQRAEELLLQPVDSLDDGQIEELQDILDRLSVKDVKRVQRRLGLAEDEGPDHYARSGQPVRHGAQHAPTGGIDIGGKHYTGGEFIPADVVEQASPEQKAHLAASGDNGSSGSSGSKKDSTSASTPPRSPARLFLDDVSRLAEEVLQGEASHKTTVDKVYAQAEETATKTEERIADLVQHQRSSWENMYGDGLDLDPKSWEQFERQVNELRDDILSHIEQLRDAFDDLGSLAELDEGDFDEDEDRDELLDELYQSFVTARRSLHEELSKFKERYFDLVSDTESNIGYEIEKRDEAWQGEAQDYADELNDPEMYGESPEDAEDDARIHNEELAEAGNPYRILKNEDGEWYVDVPDDEDEEDELGYGKGKTLFQRRRRPLRYWEDGGLYEGGPRHIWTEKGKGRRIQIREPGTGRAPAKAKPEKPVKPTPPRPDEVLEKLLTRPTGQLSPESVQQFQQSLSSMTVKDIQQVKAGLRVKASGSSKSALVSKILAQLQKPPRPKPEDLAGEIKAAVQGGDAAAIGALVDRIGSLSGKELAALKKTLGVRVGGTKAELPSKIPQAVQAKTAKEAALAAKQRQKEERLAAKGKSKPAGERPTFTRADLDAMSEAGRRSLAGKLGLSARLKGKGLYDNLLIRAQPEGQTRTPQPGVEPQESPSAAPPAPPAPQAPQFHGTPAEKLQQALQSVVRANMHDMSSMYPVPLSEVAAKAGLSESEVLPAAMQLYRAGQAHLMEDADGNRLIQVPDDRLSVGKGRATPQQRQQIRAGIEKHIAQLAAEFRSDATGRALIPIWKLRQQVSSPDMQSFDEELHELRRQGKLRMVPIADLATANRQQIQESVPGINETLFYVEPQQGKKVKPATAPTAPPHSQPAAKPAPVDRPQVMRDVLAANKSDPRTALTPPIPALYDAIKSKHPGLTEPEFHQILRDMQAQDMLTMQGWGSYGSGSLKQGTGYDANRFPPHPIKGIASHVQTRPGAEETLGKAAQARPQKKPAVTPAPAPSPAEHGHDVMQRLHRLAANHSNLIPMTRVREALAHLPRQQQDAALGQLRQEGRLSGHSEEGRYGINPEQEKAALPEPGGKGAVHYLSVKPEEGQQHLSQPAGEPAKASPTPAPAAASPAPEGAVDPRQEKDADYEIGKAFRTRGFVAFHDGEADIDILARNLQRAIPDLSEKEFKQLVLQANKQGAVELHIINEQQKISPEMRKWQIYITKKLGDHAGDVVPLGMVILKDRGKLQQVVKDFLANRHSAQAAHAQHQIEPVPGGF